MAIAPLLPDLVDADCDASNAVGDCVYPTGTRVSGKLQVALADPRDATKSPAFGVIVEKLTSTTCVVRTRGELDGVYSGLSIGAMVWLDLNGLLTQNNATIVALSGGEVIVQSMGIATDVDLVQLRPEMPMVRIGV